MRLLVWGQWSHTGFGRVTKELGERFLAAGVDVRVIAVNHRGEPVQGPLSSRVWPANINGDGFGASFNHLAIDGTFWKSYDAADDWKPDVGLIIADVSGLRSYIGQRIQPQWHTIPILHYCPIEGDNLAVSWRDVWGMFQPVAMSEYGRKQMAAHIGRDVPMIYHGVNTETFRPVSVTDPFVFDNLRLSSKEDCKRAFGFDPSRKLVLRADRAVQRKFYDVTRVVSLGGAALTEASNVWFLPDRRNQDVSITLQLRQYDRTNPNWYKAFPNWFDANFDSPRYLQSGAPNDLVIVGTVGHPQVAGDVKAGTLELAGWLYWRSKSGASSFVETLAGTDVDLSVLPQAYQQMVAAWKVRTAVSSV